MAVLKDVKTALLKVYLKALMTEYPLEVLKALQMGSMRALMTVHMMDSLLVALKENVMEYHLILQLGELMNMETLTGESMLPLIK